MVATTTSNSSLLDIISQSSGLGTLSASYADLLSGFNHRSLGSAIPIHKEGAGIVFFTRPNLNLSYDNLAQDRMLTPLLTNNQLTYQRAIRAMLDPEGNLFNSARGITTPLFDAKNAFMPLLTNGLISLNGWPDISLDTYTSKEGRLRENWSMVDGTSKNYTTFDLQASFRNYSGDPITLLFAVWATYMDHVHTDIMTPYLKSIVMNRVDYQTRIFRFTLDPSRTYIQKYASTTGVFPIGVPIGAAMNFDAENPFSHDNAEQVQVALRCHAAEYLDPILLVEFNETVEMFNPDMADSVRQATYVKIPFQYLRLFNYKGYPWINSQTSELEWWVDTGVYNTQLQSYASLSPMTTAATPTPAKSAAVVNGTANVTAVGTSSLTPNAGLTTFLADLASSSTAAPTNTLASNGSTPGSTTS